MMIVTMMVMMVMMMMMMMMIFNAGVSIWHQKITSLTINNIYMEGKYPHTKKGRKQLVFGDDDDGDDDENDYWSKGDVHVGRP